MIRENERLVYAGETALRAPDGRLLPSVPQYMIVPVEQADPASITTLHKDERLVVVGTVHSRTSSDVKTLYIKEAAENINKVTGLSRTEEKVCNAIIPDLAESLAKKLRNDKPKTESQMPKVKVYEINTTDGKRYGLEDAISGDVLINSTSRWKTRKGAERYAERIGYEVVV